MGRESPEDIERSSDDILDILEQDITIPFDCPTASLNEPVFPEIFNASAYAAQIGPRNCGPTASAEPESKLTTPRRGISNTIAPTVSVTSSEHREDRWEENAAEQSVSEAADRKLARGQNIIKETAIGVEEPELEDGRTVDLQGSEEDQFLPIPVARAKRGRSFRTTASLSRRTRTLASASKPKPIETVSDNEEETSTSVERQAEASTVHRMPTSNSKARLRKVKEESKIPVEGKNSKTTRSATVAGDGRRSFAAKAPATRTSSRRTPATAPSGASVADEREHRAKENPRRSGAVPHEGASAKITRNSKAIAEVRTTSKTAATTRIKDENEDEAPRRSTRARARTKT